MSGPASMSEERMAARLVTDLSILTSRHLFMHKPQVGFHRGDEERATIGYEALSGLYVNTPGLVSDKLKAVLKFVWDDGFKDLANGIVFAYDEAQIMADHEKQGQFPLSLILEVFQYLQRTGYPYLLVLTGLPTLNARLVSARTYSERMFHTIFLTRLDNDSSRQAIIEPTLKEECHIRFSDDAVDTIAHMSGGYPYLIQYLCREAFDVWIEQYGKNEKPIIPSREILRKLDNDFFSARWDPVTDRQRQLMCVISRLDNCDEQFAVQDIVRRSKKDLDNHFSPSQVSNMLSTLSVSGLVFKNRHGKYSFAVPLLSQFIKRQIRRDPILQEAFGEPSA